MFVFGLTFLVSVSILSTKTDIDFLVTRPVSDFFFCPIRNQRGPSGLCLGGELMKLTEPLAEKKVRHEVAKKSLKCYVKNYEQIRFGWERFA